MVDADEALRLGLVSRVVPDADLLDEARKLARRIAQHPPEAVRMTRRLMRQAWNNSLPMVLEMSAAMQAIAHHTDDYTAAVARFLAGSAKLAKGG